jgi:hypothetical protein
MAIPTPTTQAAVAAIIGAAVQPLQLTPSPRGRVLLRLMRHQARYLDLFNAADAERDAVSAAAWDLALIRVEADIRGIEDDIVARPIYSVANLVDRALVAHARGLSGACGGLGAQRHHSLSVAVEVACASHSEPRRAW